MFCARCSFPIEAEDLFCRRCGRETPLGKDTAVFLRKRLRRSADEKKLAGVCGGVARYFGQSPKVVRALWTGASLLPFSPGLIAYGLCWAAMPRERSASQKLGRSSAAR